MESRAQTEEKIFEGRRFFATEFEFHQEVEKRLTQYFTNPTQRTVLSDCLSKLLSYATKQVGLTIRCGRPFFIKATEFAEAINRTERSVREHFHELVQAGFLELLQAGKLGYRARFKLLLPIDHELAKKYGINPNTPLDDIEIRQRASCSAPSQPRPPVPASPETKELPKSSPEVPVPAPPPNPSASPLDGLPESAEGWSPSPSLLNLYADAMLALCPKPILNKGGYKAKVRRDATAEDVLSWARGELDQQAQATAKAAKALEPVIPPPSWRDLPEPERAVIEELAKAKIRVPEKNSLYGEFLDSIANDIAKDRRLRAEFGQLKRPGIELPDPSGTAADAPPAVVPDEPLVIRNDASGQEAPSLDASSDTHTEPRGVCVDSPQGITEPTALPSPPLLDGREGQGDLREAGLAGSGGTPGAGEALLFARLPGLDDDRPLTAVAGEQGAGVEAGGEGQQEGGGAEGESDVGLTSNKVCSLKAILAKPEQRLGVQELAPSGSMDTSGNPRYRMPDAIKQAIQVA